MAFSYQGCASYCLHHSTEDFLWQSKESGSTVYYGFISIVLGRKKKKKKKEKLYSVVTVMQIPLSPNQNKAAPFWQLPSLNCMSYLSAALSSWQLQFQWNLREKKKKARYHQPRDKSGFICTGQEITVSPQLVQMAMLLEESEVWPLSEGEKAI